jgi:hypothetical protein
LTHTNPFVRARLIALLAISVGVILLSMSVAQAATKLPPVVNGKHVMWGAGQGYPAATQVSANNLIYHGGLVETVPAVYLVYWGTEWQQGFSFTQGSFTYTNATVQNYVNSFFTNAGGSAWAGVQTQYCQNISLGSQSCSGQPGAQFVTNPTGQLKGTWTDPTPVPAQIVTTGLVENQTNDPLETEAIAAAAHFGYDVNATYFILTPPGHGATAYGSVYCAYHSETGHTTGHGVRYAFMPYVPEQGAGCGTNSVNQNNAFGNGYLDGYSIVAGHEYAEAVTDPGNQIGIQDGWNDVQSSENGDKCAWTGLQNIALGSNSFAVQPMWSNEAGGGQGACAVTR